MKSSLFEPSNNDITTNEWMSLQNEYMLKARIYPQYDLIAQKGAIVAYQGDVTFAYEGAGGVDAEGAGVGAVHPLRLGEAEESLGVHV